MEGVYGSKILLMAEARRPSLLKDSSLTIKRKAENFWNVLKMTDSSCLRRFLHCGS